MDSNLTNLGSYRGFDIQLGKSNWDTFVVVVSKTPENGKTVILAEEDTGVSVNGFRDGSDSPIDDVIYRVKARIDQYHASKSAREMLIARLQRIVRSWGDAA